MSTANTDYPEKAHRKAAMFWSRDLVRLPICLQTRLAFRQQLFRKGIVSPDANAPLKITANLNPDPTTLML